MYVCMHACIYTHTHNTLLYKYVMRHFTTDCILFRSQTNAGGDEDEVVVTVEEQEYRD